MQQFYESRKIRKKVFMELKTKKKLKNHNNGKDRPQQQKRQPQVDNKQIINCNNNTAHATADNSAVNEPSTDCTMHLITVIFPQRTPTKTHIHM